MTGVLCTISPQNGLVPGADFVRWNGAFGSPPEVQKYFERLAIPRLVREPRRRLYFHAYLLHPSIYVMMDKYSELMWPTPRTDPRSAVV